MLDIIPAQLGFYMPAEWEKHAATWMAWPYDTITFPRNMQKVEKIFATIIYHLHLTERVELLVLDEAMKSRVEKTLKSNHVDTNKVMFHIVNYADVWMRDYGPTFLANQNREKSAWIKWKYNAYGEKFINLLKDDEAPYQIADYINQSMFEAGMVMEGGAIDVNGKGSSPSMLMGKAL
jgi:agmatine deiminase